MTPDRNKNVFLQSEHSPIGITDHQCGYRGAADDNISNVLPGDITSTLNESQSLQGLSFHPLLRITRLNMY